MFTPQEGTPRRCAVYTRKSTNPIMEHEVTSLASQREICSAYVTSQRHKSWVLLPKQYDDPGQSGTDFERPGLGELMRDIEAGQVDVVVIYKIDRLTRSLYDFVRMIEVFDRRDVTFVSVSQSFDTSDSMGRMILNILLTFSQFERELIADRVRDNIQTRKRHGKWHGGPAPFGYDLHRKRLVVVESEAETVRYIFRRFLELGSYNALALEVERSAVPSEVKRLRSGAPRGGKPLGRSNVYNILRNPIYVGEVRGREGNYPGEHPAIVSRETWEAAQALRATRRKSIPPPNATDHFLSGIVADSHGRPMYLHTEHNSGKAYHYYISSAAAWAERGGLQPFRAIARKLDALVLATLANFLLDREALRQAVQALGIYGPELDKLTWSGAAAAGRLRAAAPPALKAIASAVVRGIELSDEHMVLTLRCLELRRFLQWPGTPEFHGRPAEWGWTEAKHAVRVPVRTISLGRTPVVPVAARDPARGGSTSPELLALLREARQAQRMVEERRDKGLDDLARTVGRRPLFFSRLLRLNYLAPDIVMAILDGTQPADLTRLALLEADLPMDWAVQREMFGFPPVRDRHRAVRRGSGRKPFANSAEAGSKISLPPTAAG